MKDLRCTGRALKAKWIWRYVREKRALWRRVVQQKFQNNEEVHMPSDDATNQGRSMWKNILNSSNFLLEKVSFKLNNGRATRFWLDNWTSLGPIKNRYPAVYKACRNKTASVSDMILEGRLVCYSRRRFTQLEQMEWDMLCNELGPVHSLNGEEDQIDIMEGFTVKKCYDCQMEDDSVWDFEKFLWKKTIPPKVSFMLWANFHESLPTRSML